MGLFTKHNLYTDLADKAQSNFDAALERIHRPEFDLQALGFSEAPASKPNAPKDRIEWEPHRRILKILKNFDQPANRTLYMDLWRQQQSVDLTDAQKQLISDWPPDKAPELMYILFKWHGQALIDSLRTFGEKLSKDKQQASQHLFIPVTDDFSHACYTIYLPGDREIVGVSLQYHGTGDPEVIIRYKDGKG